ncbi:uncharacterized protein LOC134709499 [Mytilus trossulus]|uniref:uncharacterized protein LOC134709499 n=1 Tax=Mytilus trossulus TaxID=6551 RepID=UPI003003B955
MIAVTGEAYYMRWVYSMFGLPLIEYSGKPYSVDECMDKCFSLMRNGYACLGFEYSLGNSTCRFLEANFQNDATKYYLTPYWDHYMLGSTTPIIGGPVVYDDEVITTSGGRSESYSDERVLTSSIPRRSNLKVNDLRTTAGESSEILNHKSTTSTKLKYGPEKYPSIEGITFWGIVLAIGAVTSFGGIFLIIHRILKTPHSHDLRKLDWRTFFLSSVIRVKWETTLVLVKLIQLFLYNLLDQWKEFSEKWSKGHDNEEAIGCPNEVIARKKTMQLRGMI